MATSDRRTAYVRLLAEIDQRVAECKDLSQQVVNFEEHALVRARLRLRLRARSRVETLIAKLEPA
jgi:hypothetical protein